MLVIFMLIIELIKGPVYLIVFVFEFYIYTTGST